MFPGTDAPNPITSNFVFLGVKRVNDSLPLTHLVKLTTGYNLTF